MQEVTTTTFAFPSTSRDALSEILRQGAQAMLTTAIEAEVAAWIDSHRHLEDERGRRQIVRNGYLPERSITTGLGPVKVRQPRVHDRRPGEAAEPFSSKILPPYLRKTRSLEELLPWLYLKGISTGDFNEALSALVGPECPGLSASTVTRLVAEWQDEYKDWSKRSLQDKRVAANQAFDSFLATYGAKYPKAWECLEKDRGELLTFYDFPAEHWMHLRTTNPIESVFATVRLRHRRTKGSGSRAACLAMVHQLMLSASKRWKLLNGAKLLADVIQGVQFTDGVKSQEVAA